MHLQPAMKCTGHRNALTPVPEPKPAWAGRQQYKARLVVQASGGKPNPLGNDNPLALAFLGDAVWTLYVRRRFLQPPKHARLYQAAVRPLVTAEGQAQVYDRLMLARQLLQPSEVTFLRAVRAWENVKLRQRFAGSAAAADVYRKATALEALVGHLHLHDPERLDELMSILLPLDPAPPNAPSLGPALTATTSSESAGPHPTTPSPAASSAGPHPTTPSPAASSAETFEQAAGARQQGPEG